MRRTRALIIGGVAAGALAFGVSAAASAGAPAAVTVTSGPLSVKFTPSTHTPKVNAKWALSVTATLSGKPAHATAVYEFLFGGMVVSTQYPSNNKHYTFTGHFSDNLVFPAASVGQPLTLRVVIKAGGHTVNLNWSIKSHM